MQNIDFPWTVAAVALTLGCWAGHAQAATVSEDVADAQRAIASQVVNPDQWIGPLLERLRTTGSATDRSSLLSALTRLGDSNGDSPSYIKAYVQRHLPPVALQLAGDLRNDWTLRGQALMALRTVEADEAALRQAIELARNDRSSHQSFIASRGLLLKTWLDHRIREGLNNVRLDTDVDPAKEAAAIAFLKTRGLRPTYDQLLSSLRDAEPEEVIALLDAQVFTQQRRATHGDQELFIAAGDACFSKGEKSASIAMNVRLLVQRGYDINAVDNQNNSALMRPAGTCPLVVVHAFVANGAKVGVLNAGGTSELTMAILQNRWDNARFLVDRGSRLSAKQMDDLFVELPEDPDQRAIVQRGTRAK